MRPWVGIAKKDTLQFFRSKSTVFWTIAFPLIMMLFFSAVFGGGEAAFYDIAVVDQDEGEIASVLVKALNSTGVVAVHQFKNFEEAREAVRLGEEDLVGLLLIPKGFTANLSQGFAASVKFYVREGSPQVQQVLTSFMTGFVERFNGEYRRRMLEHMFAYLPPNVSWGGHQVSKEMVQRWMLGFAKPINITVALLSRPEVTAETAAYWENEGHWASVMFAYSFIFSGMVGAAGILAYEKMLGGLKRIRMSPASVWEILAGKVAGELLMLTLSQLILVVTTLAILRPEVNWSLSLIPLILAGDLASASLGLLVAEASPDPKAANEATVTVGVLLQFFSGMYFPVQFLPGPLRAFAEVLPFTKAVEALDGVLLQGFTLSQVAGPAMYLGAMAVVFTALAVALFPKWAREG